jgi:DNA mismatch repair protein MutH
MPRKLLFKRDADFNINNAESLLKWACWLKGKKLKDSLALLPENHQRIALNELEKISKATILPDGTYKGPKGKLGILVEVIHFGLSPDNAAEADLKDAGLELKVTGVIKNKNGIRAKERLSLGMIDYRRSALEKPPFENDLEIQKSLSGMLIMTYWYKARTTNPLDLEFNDSFIWKPEGEEREMIKRDWALHQATIRCGYAHMLTERYSNGLGAPPKGAGGNSDFIKQYTPIPHSYGQLKNEFIELGVEEDQADYLIADYKVRTENPGDGKKGFATPEKSDKIFELGPFPARRRCYSLTNAYLTKLVKLRADGKI